MKKTNSQSADPVSAEQQAELLKHIARFVHDIRTPLIGTSKNSADASELLLSLLATGGLPAQSEPEAQSKHSPNLDQLIRKLRDIETYAHRADEIVNKFWAETRDLLSDNSGKTDLQSQVRLHCDKPDNPEKARGRVLLVDDNEFNQQVGLEMLKELGFQVTIASNGFQALEILKSDSFQFVLMDCRLPGLDGWETTMEIRKKQEGASIPIVGLTASLDENDFKRAVDAGMNDCLSKPLTIDTLERTVDIYGQ